jgi:hypothetical protein
MTMATIDSDSPAAVASRPVSQAEGGMFSPKFNEVAASEIISEVRSVGYWTMGGAYDSSYVDTMLGEIDFDGYLVNSNAMGVVCASTQRFVSHCLATSKRAYDIITSERVLEICRAYFDGPFKLTNQRIYQTHSEGHMPWHTDNNCQSGSVLTGKHQLQGLLFLIYLSDVTENAFQILRNSQEWSKKHTGNYFSDHFIESNHKDDVMTFENVRGTLFVCDIHAIHRATPFKNKDYERFTLLFQVDAVSPEYPEHGEKLLVNTAFVGRQDGEVLNYLGFGKPAGYPTFPCTSAATMAMRDLWAMQRALIPKAIQAGVKACAKALIPGTLLVNLKRWKWRLRGGSAGPTTADASSDHS